MSSAAARIPFITAEEYLEGEKLAAVKHEYVDGQVYAMSGASDRHNQISGDIYSRLKEHLRDGPCRTYLLDLKVQVKTAESERFYYPDVFVTCDPGDTDSHVKRHPKLVIEVLSPSTWQNDCINKLEAYQRVPAVEEIVLIAQEWPEITVFRRSDGWKPHAHSLPESLVRFESVGYEAPLASFYESAPFPPDVKRPWYLTDRPEG